MKKFLIPILIGFTLVSCKKENAVSEAKTTDSVQTEKTTEPIATNENKAGMKEISEQKVTELIKNKENDTIYVTNFFATWCGPCMREIPHFKKKMEETKGKPVKFTFVSVDDKEDWQTSVKDFAENNQLKSNLVLFDTSLVNPNFFTQNFKEWDGGSIPFTLITKGKETYETLGMMSEEELNKKIDELLTKKP